MIDDLETYAYLSVMETLKAGIDPVHMNGIGMRPKTDFDTWVDFYPMGDVRRRSRAKDWGGRIMFQVSCNAKIEEDSANRDTMAAHRLAALVRKTLEHKDLAIKTIGVAPEPTVATLNIKEARQRYLPRRNITFEGEGNFAVEQGNTHTVVVTFQATLEAA